MSTNVSTPSLLILPVELLHRIFDDLDVQTILLSLRRVCKQLKAIVNTYNRYTWNFKSISKPAFHIICRVIHPRNVISLTLSDDDETPGQIDLFLSLFRIRQFDRLRSLTLLAIKQLHLNIILKHVTTISLALLSVNMGERDRRRKNTTTTLLSSVVAQPNLCELILDMGYDEINNMTWPAHCSVQHLGLNGLVTLDQLYTILRASSHLRTLVLKDIHLQMIGPPSILTCCPQLMSLTLEEFHMEMDELDMLLSLTPSLVHLKMIGTGNLFDGNRWEQFIQINLHRLDKFEFFFSNLFAVRQNIAGIQSIIARFQTPFWLEHKRWYVTCEYSIGNLRVLRLYSIPICKTSLKYESKSNRISCSTFIMTKNNDASVMDNIKEVSVDLSKVTAADIESKIEQPSYHLFRQVTHLELRVESEWPRGSPQFLSTLIDLSRLVQLTLYDLSSTCNQNIKADILSVLHQAYNASSFEIRLYWSFRKLPITTEHIFLWVPDHVKHLRVQMSRANETKKLFKQLESFEHLSSVTIIVERYQSQAEIIEWLTQKKSNSTYQKNWNCVKMWFGKNVIQPNETEVLSKRMKLSDDCHD